MVIDLHGREATDVEVAFFLNRYLWLGGMLAVGYGECPLYF